MLEPEQALFLKVNPEEVDPKKLHYVRYSASTIATISCNMAFANFPFDVQNCPYHVSSASYTDHDVIFNASVESQLERSFYQSFDISILEDKAFVDHRGHSIAGFSLKLTRRPNLFVFKYYLPAFCIVMVSWISFLIPPDAIPGRTGLLVTLFLVTATIFGNMQASTSRPLEQKKQATEHFHTLVF